MRPPGACPDVRTIYKDSRRGGDQKPWVEEDELAARAEERTRHIHIRGTNPMVGRDRYLLAGFPEELTVW